MRLKDDNKAENIRRKAIAMIVKEGFDGLSMQKLAKSAKISPSTIYTYFESREDLLNKLFIETQADFEKDALRNFDPGMSFEEGLWLQWKNRYKNITRDPLRFYFHEQFRNSPLIKHKDIQQTAFRKNITQFVKNAIARREIAALPQEIFWAMAYGPFYALIKFHLDDSTMAGNKFSLSEQKMRQAFRLVIKSLKP